jgi:hypothetical protein
VTFEDAVRDLMADRDTDFADWVRAWAGLLAGRPPEGPDPEDEAMAVAWAFGCGVTCGHAFDGRASVVLLPAIREGACADCMARAATTRRFRRALRKPHGCHICRYRGPLTRRAAYGDAFAVLALVCRDCRDAWDAGHPIRD